MKKQNSGTLLCLSFPRKMTDFYVLVDKTEKFVYNGKRCSIFFDTGNVRHFELRGKTYGSVSEAAGSLQSVSYL